MVRNLLLAAERDIGTERMAYLFLVSYLFLLRVPSEALPMQRGGDIGSHDRAAQSVLYLEDSGTVCLRLRSRKNRPEGSVLRRSCACSACPKICPVHGLWFNFFHKLPVGAQPWSDVTPSSAISSLRQCLAALSVRLTAFPPSFVQACHFATR